MFVKSLVSNIIIDISYNLNKYIQYKHVWKPLAVVCLHLHTLIALYRSDGNEKLLKVFAYLVATVHCMDRNRVFKKM